MTNKQKPTIICIGTSTGGPRALQNVLQKLPANIDAPILVVQHMPPRFTHSLANRLNVLADIKINEAENREVIGNGTVYIAPGGTHMKVRESDDHLRIELDESELRNGHRPSVNELFESLAKMKDYEKIAVIMTGMGSDGTEGLLALKNNDDTIAIAESEETCIVYGMPRTAILTNQVDAILPLHQIGERITEYVTSSGRTFFNRKGS